MSSIGGSNEIPHPTDFAYVGKHTYTVQFQAHEDQCTLRTCDEHDEQCREVEADLTTSKSKEYSINRRSALDDLSTFHMCTGALLPDIMHDVLEGGLQYETKLSLCVRTNILQ